MCNKDEWKWIARGTHEHCINIPIVPNMETPVIFCPLIDERVSIGHYVISLMAINIHSVHLFTIFPVQFCKPTLCCRQ
jgi:hypothetical protein